MNFDSKTYRYADRIGNLKAEAVGVVKGEKYFPVFPGNLVFKPLTKSKPFSTPLFAYAEVFWSHVIDRYFMPAPRYQLAFCQGYEKETGKYYDYGTVVPMIYGEKEHLMNLLEFFRAYPDKKADIDQYLNYCQMFYDYTNIFETDFFQEHTRLAEELATHVLVSILKGDQNYHYENVAFVCDSSNRILRIAPMIDHEFSTYFMFPDATGRHLYWFGQLQRSIAGAPVAPEEFAFLSNPEERSLMEKSATCLHKNLLYIKEHFPRAVQDFTSRSALLEQAINETPEDFFLHKSPGYPDIANSDGYSIGKARYKDQDEHQAQLLEARYAHSGKPIEFDLVSVRILREIKETIRQVREILLLS